MRHVERRRVVEFRVETTPDNGKFVGNAGEVLKNIRHLDARFPHFRNVRLLANTFAVLSW